MVSGPSLSATDEHDTVNDNQSFDELLISQMASASVWEFVLNLVLCAVLTAVLKRIYVRYGRRSRTAVPSAGTSS